MILLQNVKRNVGQKELKNSISQICVGWQFGFWRTVTINLF
nr:MAG TPA: hypothetical protein [Caudoviricetes sp.]